MNTIAIQSALEIINGYITLKRKEKDIKEIVETNKAHFLKACDVVAEGKNQIEVGNALVFTTERKKYAYSKAILKAEEELEAMKEAFEKKNEPTEVTKCWAVKFVGKE